MGCFKRQLMVDDNNFIEETPDTITIKDTYIDQYDCERDTTTTCVKTIDAFVAREEKHYQQTIGHITQQYAATIEMAQKLKEENDNAHRITENVSSS